MKQTLVQATAQSMWWRVRRYILPLAVLFALFGAGLYLSVTSVHQIVLRGVPESQHPTELAVQDTGPEPFPLSVDPEKKVIYEDPNVEDYFQDYVDSRPIAARSHTDWFGRVFGVLARAGWYQNLASPMSRTLVIQSGERKEQVAKNFGDILKWDATARKSFIEQVASSSPELSEGKFFPAAYVVPKGATTTEVVPLVNGRFSNEVLMRYSEDIEEIVPLKDALTIASLLEREAYDFEDMRQISGVVWNRLFIGMPLQIDATLQYAKGSKPSEPWWPKVRPEDKYIKSPFNTYQNEGLPPAPIANPSLDAILAALNPKKTDCYFYFHDKRGEFHCTPTYEEHVALLKQYYGRGR